MNAGEGDEKRAKISKPLGAVAVVALVAGPAYAMLAREVGPGALIFAAGLVLLGVSVLFGDRDRKVGWLFVALGAFTAVSDLLRLLVAGPR
ncbi:Hypothetical Protein RradSPS_2807 (plasmid) [Rubrobacter radiotolerans]|uniref:Uncharacterized protein n=1 Tax=Rubrobacter radiotolerans TaxID=42256 RepID=A0A023X7S9_RUBRA|nr:hypothetical protein [Rubrobacter radiotolerans]AHY48090.1 Hypothetical Protein RradSPS_2807 [Rubrobacter radiotolerans]MDX5895365.1 hypothetical protein [Rubrobacter radiotolerans]SMC01710.1 hypothetical protein SAMN00767673_2914 [Rubrobacter radiotolerans DSM 5868]